MSSATYLITQIILCMCILEIVVYSKLFVYIAVIMVLIVSISFLVRDVICNNVSISIILDLDLDI